MRPAAITTDLPGALISGCPVIDLNLWWRPLQSACAIASLLSFNYYHLSAAGPGLIVGADHFRYNENIHMYLNCQRLMANRPAIAVSNQRR